MIGIRGTDDLGKTKSFPSRVGHKLKPLEDANDRLKTERTSACLWDAHAHAPASSHESYRIGLQLDYPSPHLHFALCIRRLIEDRGRAARTRISFMLSLSSLSGVNFQTTSVIRNNVSRRGGDCQNDSDSCKSLFLFTEQRNCV